MACELYQSPIDLRKEDIDFKISQEIELHGKNRGASLTASKTYVSDNKIILEVDDRRYRLVEYHLHHFPNLLGCRDSEHALEGKKFDAEIHYVFQELERETDEHRNDHTKIDVCSGHVPENAGDLLVIGRFIKFTSHGHHEDFTKLQVEVPCKYFEYDGALTGESSEGVVDCAPVRWIVGIRPLKFNGDEFTPQNTKTTRCLKSLDGRLILFSK